MRTIRPAGAPFRAESADIATEESAYAAENSTAHEAPWRTITRSPLAICIALMIGIQTISLTIIEFQWKVAAHNAYHETEPAEPYLEYLQDENNLTSFFGKYYAVVYAVTGLLQLFVTGGYLTRWGLLPALLVFPGALVGCSLGILVASPVQVTLGSATLTKSCETLRRGIYDAALYLLYWPMEQFVRRRAIAFSVGVAKPGFEALSGLVILELAMYFEVRQLSYFVLLLLAIWITLAIASYRRYVAIGGKQLRDAVITPDPVLE
jgi:hypothetical protein